MDPYQIFVQLAPILYFCSWLWFGFLLGLLPIRAAVRRWFVLFISLILVIAAAMWGYIAVLFLAAGANPFRLPLAMAFLLFMTIAASYFPLKPWRSGPTQTMPNVVKMARWELLGVLLFLPLGGVLIIASLGINSLDWLPSLIQSYPQLLVFIGTLAFLTVALSEPKFGRFLLGVGLILFALLSTFLVLIAALVAAI